MKKEQTRFLVVVIEAAYYNIAIRPLMPPGRRKKSDGAFHILSGYGQEADGLGVWFRKVETAWVDVDTNATTYVDLLVPWRFVLSHGIEVGETPARTVGFESKKLAGGNITVLQQADPQTAAAPKGGERKRASDTRQ